MINHGIVTGGLFLCIGMVYDRTHTRQIVDYGGTASVLPVYAGLFMVFTLASIGLPGTNGFVGEFLIILGGFATSKIMGTLSATGIIIGAGYMLWLYQRVFFMQINPKMQGYKDIDLREILTLVPLIILVFWIGAYPNTFLSFMDVSVQHLIARVNTPVQQNLAQHIIEVIQ